VCTYVEEGKGLLGGTHTLNVISKSEQTPSSTYRPEFVKAQ
jgi:hypothetical protein